MDHRPFQARLLKIINFGILGPFRSTPDYISPYDRYIRPESKIFVFGWFWVVLERFWAGWAGFGPVFGWFLAGSGPILADFGPESKSRGADMPRTEGGESRCTRRSAGELYPTGIWDLGMPKTRLR